jgi:hypothetical protein
MITNKLNKYEKNYDYLTNILKESGITTIEKVQNHLQGLMRKCLRFSLIVMLFTLGLCLLLPKYYPIWGMFGVLILAWAWASALSARKIMHDYMDRELRPSEPSD